MQRRMWRDIMDNLNYQDRTIRKLVRTYRMYEEMSRYPDLIDKIREAFLSALREKGITDPETLETEAGREIEKMAAEPDPERVRNLVNGLIDLSFAGHFDDREIQEHINVVRKKKSLRKLTRAVSSEGPRSEDIRTALNEFCSIPVKDLPVSHSAIEALRVDLIKHFVSEQLPFVRVAKQHITVEDIASVLEKSKWSPRQPGKIGGKAAGLLLAQRVVLPKLQATDSEFQDVLSIPESHFFSSGIFTDLLDYNGLYQLYDQKYKSGEEIQAGYESIVQSFKKATFPPDMLKLFRSFLEETGDQPLVLRSSALLEDNFENAFSGKYETVFVCSQGGLEDRLNEFTQGLKQIYASVFSPGPLLYRRKRNLLDVDERMGVLVQKVVGRRFGDYFFPAVSGVAFSYNTYNWTPRIKKEEGLARLVFGMGTRAVARVSRDYPRMVALSHPLLRPEVDARSIARYSQRMVDVLHLKEGRMINMPVMDLLRTVDHPDLFHLVSIFDDGNLSSPMFKTHPIDPGHSIITFENFLTKTPFVPLMKNILSALEAAYGVPIDIEFAWDDDKLYLLQCRAISLGAQREKVNVPSVSKKELILFSNRKGVSNGTVRDVEYIVYVDPKKYGRMTAQEEKLAVAQAVRRINRKLEGKRYGLFGPGRWGSNDINLGVRVQYEDINHALILGEVAFREEGAAPEVSYGTHFFNDLVEAQVLPIALFPDEANAIFNEEFLHGSENKLAELEPESSSLVEVVRVIHVPSVMNGRMLQVFQDGHEQEGIGVFARPGEDVSAVCEV